MRAVDRDGQFTAEQLAVTTAIWTVTVAAKTQTFELGNMSNFICPVCKQKGYHQSWSEDYHGTVEAWDVCGPCGYRDGFSYGATNMIIGNKEFGYYFGDSQRFKNRQTKLFKRAVRHARRVFVRKSANSK